MTMRVLLLNYEYPPLGGGAANATRYLLDEFAQLPDLEVDLVTSSVDRARVEEHEGGITLHFLDIGKRGNLHYQTNKDLLAYAWRAWRYAKRLRNTHDYDVCHAFFGIPCGYLAMHLGLPYIVSLRGSDVPFYNERFKHLDRLLFKRLSKRIWRRAHQVVANSQGLRQLALSSAPGQPIEVIYNGVDTEAFRPAPRQGGGLRVICVSRLIARKGIDYLIRALAALDSTDISLTLVGTGNQEQPLKTLATDLGVADRIDFAGFVDHDAVAAWYQRHDVFVLPSLNEGMSNTALEAMACGLPLLMTDTGGASELLEDKVNGFLLRQRDAEDIARRLRAYAEDPELATQHGQQSREKALTLSWRAVAHAYLDLYRSSIA